MEISDSSVRSALSKNKQGFAYFLGVKENFNKVRWEITSEICPKCHSFVVIHGHADLSGAGRYPDHTNVHACMDPECNYLKESSTREEKDCAFCEQTNI